MSQRYEEEGEYEYAAYHQAGEGGQVRKQEARVEPAVLVQPLTADAAGEKKGQQGGSVVRLCQGAAGGRGSQGRARGTQA